MYNFVIEDGSSSAFCIPEGYLVTVCVTDILMVQVNLEVLYI